MTSTNTKATPNAHFAESQVAPTSQAAATIAETDELGVDRVQPDHEQRVCRVFRTPLGGLAVTMSGKAVCGAHYLLADSSVEAKADTGSPGESIAGLEHATGGQYVTAPGKDGDELDRDCEYGTLTAGQEVLAELIQTQLDSYFAGELTQFTIPLDRGGRGVNGGNGSGGNSGRGGRGDCGGSGEGFAERAQQALSKIPAGTVLTYGELAAQAGSPKAARAAGAVCRTNPIQLFIPCHRVVASDGSLNGYMGGERGLALKRALLEVEKVPFKKNGKVDLGAR